MKRIIILALTLIIVFIPSANTSISAAEIPKSIEVTRLYGQDRYETAIKIADALAIQLNLNLGAGDKFDNVVLASGNDYPDALSGAPLAAFYNAPILLLNKTPENSQTTWEYIEAHVKKSGKAILLGGIGVVTESFNNQLIKMGFNQDNIVRYGGKDPDETSLIIAEFLTTNSHILPSSVTVVSDANFYDALTMAPFIATQPILLVSPTGLSAQQKQYLDTVDGTITVFGEIADSITGKYIENNFYDYQEYFSSKVASQVFHTNERNRYTSNSFFAHISVALISEGTPSPTIYLATGEDYVDALVGPVLAGKHFAGYIILTKPDELAKETIHILRHIAYYTKSPWKPVMTIPNRNDETNSKPTGYLKLFVFGGPGAVSDKVISKVKDILNGPGVPFEEGEFSEAEQKEADFEYRVEFNEVTITGYTGPGGTIKIPNSLGGHLVTGIQESAFSDCTGTTNISLPQGLRNIDHRAFLGCTGLTAITVALENSNYTSIDGLLYNKTGNVLIACPPGLTSISLKQGIETIGKGAFEGCKGLTRIDLPEEITSIGEKAFTDCTGLTGINISEGVTNIGGSAFEGCAGLTNIKIPEGVTMISKGTFYSCIGLTNVAIPEGVTSIGNYAFNGCTGLTRIVLPQEVTNIGEYSFEDCTGLTSINIPEGVTSIGTHAFSGCAALTNVTLPEGITDIAGMTFNGCKALNSIIITKGVKNIDYGAFYGCTGLTSITFESATTTIFDNQYTIPATTKIIGYNPSTAKDYATKYNRTFEVIADTPAVTSEPAIQVYIDGTQLIMDVAPVVEQGRTLVPLRAIFEALGATVDWNATEQSITAVKGDVTLKLTIASTVAVKNGVQVTLDVPPRVINNRTLVPLRFVSEALNAKVEWDAETWTVRIYSPSGQTTPAPTNASEFFQQGYAHYSQGQYTAAVADYTKAIELNSAYAEAYEERGLIYYFLGQNDKAVADLSKAIELNSQYTLAWVYATRGRAYYQLEQYDQALADFNKAMALDFSPMTYNGRGKVYRALGQYDKAIADYTKAIEFDQMNSVYYIDRGWAYFYLNQYEKAVADFSKAIELNPNEATFYKQRAYLYNELGQYEKAIQDASKAIELNPQYVGAYYERGFAYFDLGRNNEAIADYKKILEINPKEENAKNNLRHMGVPGY